MVRETDAALYNMPDEGPNWTDQDAVAHWIGRVRAVAFLKGARHDEIDRAEARELMRHICKERRP